MSSPRPPRSLRLEKTAGQGIGNYSYVPYFSEPRSLACPVALHRWQPQGEISPMGGRSWASPILI